MEPCQRFPKDIEVTLMSFEVILGHTQTSESYRLGSPWLQEVFLRSF